MKIVIQLLEDMKKSGVITDYAIGGATALIHYFEPINTQDIDVFVIMTSNSATIATLTPIYKFLEANKCKAEKEYVIIQNIPVQFLIPYNDLLLEAVSSGQYVRYDTKKVRIITLEYLMAIMVETGRMKDKARLLDILKSNINFNKSKFKSILQKYGLITKWMNIKNYLKDEK